jgi:hypothetical protein
MTMLKIGTDFHPRDPRAVIDPVDEVMGHMRSISDEQLVDLCMAVHAEAERRQRPGDGFDPAPSALPGSPPPVTIPAPTRFAALLEKAWRGANHPRPPRL